jgi:SAM-dependent methyltransferase
MDDTAAWREQNRRSWNEATRVHNARKGDQAAWLRAGNSPLFPEEVALLGPLAGRRVAHLMCNAGQDTLGLVQLGADAVGVDISDEAIAFARALSEATALPAAFVRSDVYDWLETTDDRVDDVFTSYGGVGWLPDLPRFFRGVARVVRPGGRFVFQDFHPLCWANDADGKIIEPYFIDGPIHDKNGVGDYVGESAGALSPMGAVDGPPWTNPEPSVSFQWTLGDLLNGLANAGFRLEQLREQPWSNGCRIHPGMVVDADRRWRRPSSVAALPLMVGVVARRDA